MKQFEIGDVVNEYLQLNNHHDPIAAESDRAHGGTERELAEAPSLVVVPEHDFVGRELRAGAAADEGEYVGVEEHLDVADSAAGEVSPE